MSTRWIVPGGNALARGAVTCAGEDPLLLAERLWDLQPRSPTRFNKSNAITSSSVANPTVITATAHGLFSGDLITISGHTGSTPAISGQYVATVTGANTFTIPVNVTVGGTGGTFVRITNSVLLDSDLVKGVSPVTALEGEALQLLVGTGVTIQDTVTQEYLQDNGTWDAAANTCDAPISFTVRPYSTLQRSTVPISVSPAAGTVIIPTVDALTIHGHSGLWQQSDAIAWYSGTTVTPTTLRASAAPVAHSQLLTPASAVLERYHKLTIKGTGAYVGEAVLGRLKSITEHTVPDARQLGRVGAQERFSNPSGIVESFVWANRERIPYAGQVVAPLATSLVELERLFRAARSGADPFVLLPESDSVVLFGWIADVFGPAQVIGSALSRIDYTFEEAPHLTVIGEGD